MAPGARLQDVADAILQRPWGSLVEVYDLDNREPKLYAYDKASGRLLAEVVLGLDLEASEAVLT